MHTFLVSCVLAEGAFIALLLGWLWRESQGLRSLSWRVDSVVKTLAGLPNGLTETNWSEAMGCLYRHTEEIDATRILLADSESKLSDLSEGCARIDSDLEKFVSDLKELGNLRRNDAMEIGARLTQLADDVEKAKRRSARPATSSSSFEAIRNVAERASRKSDANHDRMVALAEGS
jgi:hypothetical protein